MFNPLPSFREISSESAYELLSNGQKKMCFVRVIDASDHKHRIGSELKPVPRCNEFTLRHF